MDDLRNIQHVLYRQKLLRTPSIYEASLSEKEARERQEWCDYYAREVKESTSLYSLLDATCEDEKVFTEVVGMLMGHMNAQDIQTHLLLGTPVQFNDDKYSNLTSNEKLHDYLESIIAFKLEKDFHDYLQYFYKTLYEHFIGFIGKVSTLTETSTLKEWHTRMVDDRVKVWYPQNSRYRDRLLSSSNLYLTFKQDRINGKVPFTFYIELMRQTFDAYPELVFLDGDFYTSKEFWHCASTMSRSLVPRVRVKGEEIPRPSDIVPVNALYADRGFGTGTIPIQELDPQRATDREEYGQLGENSLISWVHSGAVCRTRYSITDAEGQSYGGCGYSYKGMAQHRRVISTGCGISYSTNLILWGILALLYYVPTDPAQYNPEQTAKLIYLGIVIQMTLDGGHTIAEVTGMIKHICIYLLYIVDIGNTHTLYPLLTQLLDLTRYFHLFGTQTPDESIVPEAHELKAVFHRKYREGVRFQSVEWKNIVKKVRTFKTRLASYMMAEQTRPISTHTELDYKPILIQLYQITAEKAGNWNRFLDYIITEMKRYVYAIRVYSDPQTHFPSSIRVEDVQESEPMDVDDE